MRMLVNSDNTSSYTVAFERPKKSFEQMMVGILTAKEKVMNRCEFDET